MTVIPISERSASPHGEAFFVIFEVSPDASRTAALDACPTAPLIALLKSPTCSRRDLTPSAADLIHPNKASKTDRFLCLQALSVI